jgi:hypothetical protein
MRSATAVRWALGAILLIAAVLKAHQLAGGRIGDGPIVGGPVALGVVCAAEFALAAWLLSGLGSWHARATAIVAFTMMFGAALYAALGGAVSCGCLGSVEVRPGYMIALDAVAVLALAMTAGAVESQAGVGRIRFAVPTLLLGTAGSVAVMGWAVAVAYWPGQLNAGGEITGLGRRVSAEPSDWVGKRLPALSYLDRAEVISHGDWVAVFHHHRCAYCRRAVEQLRALAAEVEPSENTPRLAFIEVPPFAQVAESPRMAPSHDRTVDVRLTEQFTWVLPLPAMVGLRDGQVTELTNLSKEVMALALGSKATGDPAIGYAEGTAAWKKSLVSQVACGPLALISVMTKLGVNLSETDKDDVLGVAGSQGTDLETLKELAQQYGLHALGVETTVQGLRTRGLPAIVFVRGYGFAAATAFGPSEIEIVYPFSKPVKMSDSRFEDDFGKTGRALLLSRKQIRSTSSGASVVAGHPPGPLLRASRSMLAFGRVYRKSYNVSIDMFNDGDSTLEVTQVSSSTPTIEVSLAAMTIPPGGKTRLTVAGKPDRVGSVTESVTVSTNGVDGPVMRLPVRGYVDVPAFLPQPYVLFDGVIEGMPAEASVPVDLSPGVDRGSLSCATANENYSTASLVDAADGRVWLCVVWRGTAGVGWHRLKAEIREDAPNSVPTTIDITGHVLPELEAEPKSLWIDDATLATGRWSRRVAIKRNRPGRWQARYQWSDDRADRAVKIAVAQARDGDSTILLEPDGPDAARNLHGVLATLTIMSDQGAQTNVGVRFGQTGAPGARETDEH